MRPSLTALPVVLLAGLALAGDGAWHSDLSSGMEAARTSGRPLLVVTAWKSGI